MSVDPCTPVLVGLGVAMRREEDPAIAVEPIDLMLEAVRCAGEDCSTPALLADIDTIAVPRGRWRYRNPAGEIARAIGALHAKTIVSSVGVLQQSLIATACADIAQGRIESALVTGADAGYRLLRAKLTANEAVERDQDDDPDMRLEPAAELRHPAELAAGLTMPVGLYAILESARRAAAGLDIDAHRDRLATRSARFAEIAANNPHAWNRQQPSIAEVRNAGPRNPMQAFPYTRAQCSTWNVDQAAALLLCSARRAEALGIDRARWIFPVASAESNHMVPLSARRDLTRSPGADTSAAAVLAAAGTAIDEIDLVDLYSCFPVAVDMAADAAGLGAGIDLTITGGMAFAGGPYNNYFFQATARAAELLRAGVGRTALLSCVSGILTKQAFALWSIDPPKHGFVRRDVTAEVAGMASAQPLPVVQDYSGPGVIAGCTVLHTRGAAPIAVALLDTPAGERALAVSDEATVLAGMELDEWVGRRVEVSGGRLLA
ncbi:acetyl-CoA acetyltransferase [Sphingomonas glacialis]|uniref:Acetyl-CoA acetyltransferase n=1 Tax=Sphingomonas glacialis TaxID=658225 RepID=A0ABQ3LTX4_9SPHN|nr:acetyl-CoA acetyltransferase [Sphingomonas glacialis]GHH24012.1 acetyl-CoA acetyltransferase [Sphingomonas glacialis]